MIFLLLNELQIIPQFTDASHPELGFSRKVAVPRDRSLQTVEHYFFTRTTSQ